MRGVLRLLSQLEDAELSAAVKMASAEADAPDMGEVRKLSPAHGTSKLDMHRLAELAVGICELPIIEGDIENVKRELEEVRSRLIDARSRLSEEKLLFATYSKDNLFLKRALREE